MKKTLPYLLSLSVVLAGAATMRTIRAQETTSYPGQPTRATVWIQNRGSAEAVPVAIESIGSRGTIPVEVTGISTVNIDPSSVIRARIVRQSWEYRVVSIAAGQNPVAALSGPGADGWEATGLAFPAKEGTAVLMKRPN
jgi:hypothetical protein